MSVTTDATAIRPFHVEFSDEAIDDLRRRIQATRLPEKETVADTSQGVQLATMQALARYWGTEYDFGARRGEAERAAAVHDRDRRPRHPLHPRRVAARERAAADHHPRLARLGHRDAERRSARSPTRRHTAASAEDAFDVVIPSMPGYGFSGKPTETGWDPEHIARAWIALMKRLGYTRFVAQGGDWGAQITDVMGAAGARRSCSGSTPTCPARCRPTSPRCALGRRAGRRPASRPRRTGRTSS